MSPMNNERFGLAAQRPLVASLRDKGTIWYSTDTDEVWTSDGVDWTQLGGGGGSSTLFGLFAGRPLATSVTSGTFYYATDTGDTYVSDGAAWFLVGSAGAPQYAYTYPQSMVNANYAATLADRTIILNAGGLTVTLPLGANTVDTMIIVKDYGFATASPHTILPGAGDTIDHAASFSVNVDNMSVQMAYNTADLNWMVM